MVEFVEFVKFKDDCPIFIHGNFTPGKNYQVVDDNPDGTYMVIDDNGDEVWENKSSFKSVLAANVGRTYR